MENDGSNLRALRDAHHCVYCGDYGGIQRDHVIPTSYLRVKRRYEGDWLVPSCAECNRTLGAESIFNVPDRAYYLLKAYERKYQKALKAVPWCQEEIDDLGPNMRAMITEHEEARRALMQRLDHLQVVSAQHVTYLAPLRPAIDPEIEDVPEFIDDDLSNRRERRLDLSQKAKGRFRAREVG